jgi:pyruvate dehydrogenase E2 component (dihydrolipoamide acetyltransferase)
VTAMPVEVIMPKVDMDMARGKFALWHVKEGGSVAKGAPLFDIETDKSAMEVESPAAGRLHHVTAKPGEEIDVGTTIAWIFGEGETIGIAAAKQAEPEKTAAAPAPRKNGIVQSNSASPAGKTAATPLARRLARMNGLKLSTVAGTGPRQRIQKADVELTLQTLAQSGSVQTSAASASAGAQHSPAQASTSPLSAAQSGDDVAKAYAGRPFTEIPVERMRAIIARRLTESKQTVPHFYLRCQVRLDALLELRVEMNASLAARGVKISVNDFIIKALALALQVVPDANVAWAGDRILRFERSDIAVAVAVEGGLFTPVIRDAERKSLSALSAEMKELAAKARSGSLLPSDYQGGSIAISNLGMFGIDDFDAIISPPQAAILAVGAARKRPVIAEDQTVAAAMIMALTLSVDHRVIDGDLGAKLIQSIKSHLENPMAILA